MSPPRSWSRLIPSGPSGAPARRPRPRPRLEELEGRLLPAAGLVFDRTAGSLALVGDGAGHTAREALSPGGFVEVAVDGRLHSGDAASASFDPALAGAAAGTLRGIAFDGGGRGTLILGGQSLPGSLTVRSDADVLTQDVSVAGTLSIQAAAVRVAGSLRGSDLTLAGSAWVTVEAGGRLSAERVEVSAGAFVHSGQVHADGPAGGQVVIHAAKMLDAGPITADGTAKGGGGSVSLAFTDTYVATTAALLSADGGAGGPGGRVTLDGGTTGELFSSGRQRATGLLGGGVDLFGQSVVLDGATLDASGQSGGGSVRVGGDSRGGNAAVANAQTVTVTGATALRADARGRGEGGRVVVWSDRQTQFAGAVSARGGLAGGGGGLIEVSGKGELNYGGAADAGAPAGKAGALLLDPKNLILSAAPAGVLPQFDFVDPHPTAGGHFGTAVTVLSTGNVVVTNPYDNFGGSHAGAVYLYDGLTGALLSALVGTSPNDFVGVGVGVTALSNGNYVVRSPDWNGLRGAVTWASGTAGLTGTVSAANSLVGSSSGDQVGDYGVTALSNGNYVVVSRSWNGGRGAATWASGTAGVTGAVSAADSLTGTSAGDHVGNFGITALSNGNYVAPSPDWNGQRGAATWGSGTAGVRGTISVANSLTGSAANDRVGDGILALVNGNYVVASPGWNGHRGAVTWASGTAGVAGTISAANSLTGSAANDQVGVGVGALSNGNYVVASAGWNGQRGAVTWGSGTAGVTGPVSAANSLVGSSPNDLVGNSGITALSNGNYVVGSAGWNGSRGAATWGSGTAGVTGTVSSANSLTGTAADHVGAFVTALSNGDYVAGSPDWNVQRGAVTWGDGTAGVTGVVSAANSLVGSSSGDSVGQYGVTALSNGDYVAGSPNWNGRRGAATWASGTAGLTGTVSADNSLTGTSAGDAVGSDVTALGDGNYVVGSPFWNGSRGAATWGSGTAGVTGTVSSANSLTGTAPGDKVGNFGVTALGDGDYVVLSPDWNGGRGAATWASGTSGQTLDGRATVTAQNSLAGQSANAGLGTPAFDPTHQSFLAAFPGEGGGRVTAGLTDPNQFTYARGQGQTVTLTPDLLTRTLNGGTAVVLQASNDLTVEDPILVGAGGQGGALTLQAGRSILLNADIRTDNGALTLTANDTVADGVVDSQRDPGNAYLTMAGGTTLDAGTGALDVELRDGAGLRYDSSRAINLEALHAGSVSVVNNGPSAGSDLRLGPVTTTGPQSYASPQGTTTVAGDLTAADSPITFTDAVVLGGGVSVTAGAGGVTFAGGGAQALRSGSGATLDSLYHTGSGTLQLTGALTVTGGFANAAGTFDANDQAVTVAGAALVSGGAYLAGTGPQTFGGGLTLAGGLFTSSSGPLTVSGGVTLSGGQLSGSGTVDALTAAGGGTVAPATLSQSGLTVTGAVRLDAATTFRVLLDGGDQAELFAGGPVDLGGSTLSLTFGSEPPVGGSFEILTTTDAGGVGGTFAGLDEGSVFEQGGYQFQITYRGGPTGTSVVLTRVA